MTSFIPHRIPKARWSVLGSGSIEMSRLFMDALATVITLVHESHPGASEAFSCTSGAIFNKIPEYANLNVSFMMRDIPFLWNHINGKFKERFALKPESIDHLKRVMAPRLEELRRLQSAVDQRQVLALSRDLHNHKLILDTSAYIRFSAMNALMDQIPYDELMNVDSLGPQKTAFVSNSWERENVRYPEDDNPLEGALEVKPVGMISFNVWGPAFLLVTRYLLMNKFDFTKDTLSATNTVLVGRLFALVAGYIAGSASLDHVFGIMMRDPSCLGCVPLDTRVDVTTSVDIPLTGSYVRSGESSSTVSKFDDLLQSLAGHAKRLATEIVDESGVRDSSILFTEEANFTELSTLNSLEVLPLVPSSGSDPAIDERWGHSMWALMATGLSILASLKGTVHSNIVLSCAPALENLVCLDANDRGRSVSIFDMWYAFNSVAQHWTTDKDPTGFYSIPPVSAPSNPPDRPDESPLEASVPASHLMRAFASKSNQHGVIRGFVGNVDISRGSYHSIAFPELTDTCRFVDSHYVALTEQQTRAFGPTFVVNKPDQDPNDEAAKLKLNPNMLFVVMPKG